MEYETIYNFKVIDEIKKGEDVFMIDKRTKYIHIANNVPTQNVVIATQDDTGRYEFYKIVGKQDT